MTEQTPAVDPIITPPKKPRVRLPRPSARRWGMNPEDRLRVMEAVYVVPAQGWIVHFGLMMLMSVIVAIMGLSANSPALVIGAMLIAPLMTPVLGIAASISMALGDALVRAVTTVVLATVGAIFIGWLLAGWLPQPLLTGEVLARTAPDLRDLVVALAAGVAGSYATAKPDVSSSLPGVAIAVALVPPLAVVGICLRAGRSELASGALLLYGTNLAAIITVSTIVFVIAGFVPGRRLASMAPRVLAGGFIAFVVVALLGILLATRSIDASNSARDVAAVREATDTWLSGTFDESEVELDGSIVRVRVIGPSEPPDTTEYRAQLEQELGEPAELEISWIQGQTSESIQLTTAAARAIEQTTLVPDTVDAWLNDAGGADVFNLSDLTYSRDEISFVITSLVAPPSAQDLHARLEAETGVAPVPVITWRDLSAEALAADLASIDQIESAARVATEEWALPLDIDVDEVSFDGTRLSIDIAGIVRPDGSELERTLAEIVGTDTEIDVGFLQRSSVIPAPTATPTPLPTATPAPTATPTPVPTSTPVPTPDVTPTPG